MNRNGLKILCLEDIEEDAIIISNQLKREGLIFHFDHVTSASEYTNKLNSEKYDIILSDYYLPGFSGIAALLLSKKICPEVPFICISGTIGEDMAVELMHIGASDYIVKDKLSKLHVAIERALKEKEEHNSRIEAENSLKESEARLRDIIMSSYDWIWEIDRNWNYCYTSDSVSNILGYIQSEIIGKSPMDFMTDDEKEKNGSAFSGIAGKKGIIKDLENWNLHKDGHRVCLLTNAFPILNETGDLIGYRGVDKDITDRKLAEEEIRKLSRATEQSPVSILITDLQGNITYANPTAVRITGYSLNELMGKNLLIFSTGKEPQEEYKNLWEILNSGREWKGEFHNKKKNGELYWESVSISPILDEKGEITHFLAIKEDITERRIAEQTIRDLNANLEKKVKERTKQLASTNEILTREIKAREKTEVALSKAKKVAEDANKAKSDFLANMSHEIRTPMNAVIGYSELLSSTKVDSVQKDYINSIKSSGKSLLKLINDILDLSKIEAGKLELEYEFVNTFRFFEEFEKIFAFKVNEKGIKFILEIIPGTPDGIYVDEARLRQIVLNLIGNAFKFTSQGQIILRIYSENSKRIEHTKNKTEEIIDLIIEVEDTGLGISREMQDKIFEPFVQEHDFRDFGGTGLGLSISRRLAGLMKGEISLKSEPGKGTIFTLRIPDTISLIELTPILSDISVDPAEIIFNEAKIVIVDDVQNNRGYLKDALKDTALKIYEAENGAIGYEISKKILPELIISDIRMPELDGFGLLEKIKSDPETKHIPVLAYTAAVLEVQKDLIQNSEFAGLLIKPVRINELYFKLMNILPHRRIEANEDPANKAISETSESIIDIAGLIHSLETELSVTWKTFALRQPIGEVSIFGKALTDLGNKHNSSIITNYGTDLSESINSYNIAVVLKLLKKYPSVVSDIKNLAKQI